jgi:hypothetical protein
MPCSLMAFIAVLCMFVAPEKQAHKRLTSEQ